MNLQTSRFVACASLLLPLLAAGCGGGGGEQKPMSKAAPAGSPPARAAQVDPATAATIQGMVRFEDGGAPAPQRIDMGADKVCQDQHPDGAFTHSVVVNDNGTLQNVFVYVKKGLEGMTFPTPTQPVELDQQGCQYHPHVFGIQTGQPLKIVNDDSTLHNIHARPSMNRDFNMAQPMKGMSSERTFATQEVMVPFKCDVHPWMNAYGGVVSHPYFAVTGDQGTFTLKNLPPGDYVVEAWHEKYGTQEQTVKVGPKEQKSIEFVFKAS